MRRTVRAGFRDPRKCAAQSAEGFVTPQKRAALAALPLRGLQEHTLMGRIAATSLLQGYPKLRFGFFGVALSSEYLQPGLVIEVHLHQVVGKRNFSTFQGSVKQGHVGQ